MPTPSFLEDILVEAVTLGIDLFVCAVLYKGYHDLTTTAAHILASEQIPLDEDVASAVVQRGRSGGKAVVPYAAVRGRVRPLSSSLLSQFVRAKGVIQKVSFVEHSNHLTKAGYWSSGERELHSFLNSVPFGLSAPSQRENPSAFSVTPFIGKENSPPPVLVEVTQWDRASRVDLDVVYDNFDDSNVTVAGGLAGWLAGADIQRGMLTTERMLQTDSMVTVIGEVSVGNDGRVTSTAPSDGREYFIVKATPQALALDIREDARFIAKIIAVRHFQQQCKPIFFVINFVARQIFGGIGVLLVGRIVYLVWTKQTERRHVRKNAEFLKSIIVGRDEAAGENEPSEDSTCNVCMENPVEVKLLDCGHDVLCADCALKIVRRNRKCPICRADIVNVGALHDFEESN